MSKRATTEIVAERLEQVLSSFESNILTLKRYRETKTEEQILESAEHATRQAERSAASDKLFSLFQGTNELVLEKLFHVARWVTEKI